MSAFPVVKGRIAELEPEPAPGAPEPEPEPAPASRAPEPTHEELLAVAKARGWKESYGWSVSKGEGDRRRQSVMEMAPAAVERARREAASGFAETDTVRGACA